MSDNTYPVILSESTIVGLKPHDLGQLEIELQMPPIRTQAWYNMTAQEWHDTAMTNILNEWLAIRGWVCQRLEEPDFEGPDHHIIIAYLFGEKLYQKYFKTGYDTYHWASSYPDHCYWFTETLNPGHALTLLINPKDPEEVIIFGQLEVYVKRNGELEWCAN
jgi:hypothetical protein